MSVLIKDTTKEERERIVAEALGNMNGGCDGCSQGLADSMYQDYIDGKKELREINMEFRKGFTMEDNRPERSGCGYM
ncbi:MAG: purine biosynthesis protein PurH [Butyrivibrio sp.]|nr:purine biosynthesis protein PurH [Butyrivibrio sp.]